MRALVETCFWVCAGLVGYAYVGYALVLAVYTRFHRRPVVMAAKTPTVSIVMAAHNEEARLGAKLENLMEMEYPHDRMEIVVASDGSTDGTMGILEEWAGRGAEGRAGMVPVRAVVISVAGGKAAALNRAVAVARGEVLVFLDVRQRVERRAVMELVSCFADEGVGAVSGELLLETVAGAADNGLGIYWKIEKTVRKLESASGSVVGVTGAIYALRREFYVDIPEGTILDDVFVPMNVVRAGKRVMFQPLAIARDRIFTEGGKEFSRKVRTLTGNYQLVRLAPWLLTMRNPILFRFVSHKMLRLAVPLLLAGMLAASAASGGSFYRGVFVLQMAGYGLAGLGSVSAAARRLKPVAIAHTFAMLNVAAAVALYKFLAGRKVWV